MAEGERLRDHSLSIRKKDLIFDAVQENSLGAGSFGEVFIAKWLGTKVAAKRLYKRLYSEGEDLLESINTDQRFHREHILMSRIHHPHVVQLYGVYIPDDQPELPPVIIMELLDRTLRDLIVNGPRLLLLEVIDYSLQISSALCYLHGQKPPIIHRDLTTNNVMLTSNSICKIVDLGLAKVFDRAAQRELTSRPGHVCYMPVEILNGSKDYDERLDVFSFSILMLEMCNGRVSQPSASCFEELPGTQGSYAPVAESRRFATDLGYLGNDHKLRPLIRRLLQPLRDVPSIIVVHEELHALQQSDETLRKSVGEVRMMRHHFEQKDEAHRKEVDDLKEMILGGQQATQELVQRNTQDLHGSLRQTQEKVVEVSNSQQMLEEALRRTDRRVEDLQESLTRTTSKVEEVSDTQQTVQETLRRTEAELTSTSSKLNEVIDSQQPMQEALRRTQEKIDGLRESLTATSENIQKVSSNQQTIREALQRTGERVGGLCETLANTSATVKEVTDCQQTMQETLGKTERSLASTSSKVEEVISGQQAMQTTMVRTAERVTSTSAKLEEVSGSVRTTSETLERTEEKIEQLRESITSTTKKIVEGIDSQHTIGETLTATNANVEEVIGGQQMMQETLQKAEEKMEGLRQNLTATTEQVGQVSDSQQLMQETLKRAEGRVEALHGAFTTTTAKVEQVYESQQLMEKTLERTEASMEGLHENLTATTTKVGQVFRSQEVMQKTLRKAGERVEDLHENLPAAMAKVEQVSNSQQIMQENLTRTEKQVEALNENLTTTTEKVDEVSGGQQRMQKTLKRTEKRVDGLRESVQTTAKVEEVSGSQQTLQETLRQTETRVKGLQQTLTAATAKIDQVTHNQQTMQEALKSTERNVMTTTSKVEEVSGSQQMMQETLRKTERRVDGLQENLTTTVAKVEQAADNQRTVQEAIRRAEGNLTTTNAKVEEVAASNCYLQEDLQEVKNTVANNFSSTQQSVDGVLQASHQIHQEVTEMKESLNQTGRNVSILQDDLGETKSDVDKLMRMKVQRCSKECDTNGCTERCAKSIMHEEAERHDCGKEHPFDCKHFCQDQGVCMISMPAVHSQRGDMVNMRIGPNGLKLKCIVMCPTDQPNHSEQHHCDRRVHTCDKRCPLCDFFCERPLGHDGLCATTHGPAKNIVDLDGVGVITADGQETCLDPRLSCDKLCQVAGEGHFHMLKCTCSFENDGKWRGSHSREWISRDFRAHRYVQDGQDVATHYEFWRLLETPFLDPHPLPRKGSERCRAMCPGLDHQNPQLCTLPAGHNPCSSVMETEEEGFLCNGHHFTCPDHRCRETCALMINRWIWKECPRQCSLFDGHHSSSCECLQY